MEKLRHYIARTIWRCVRVPGRRFLEYFAHFQVKGEEHAKGFKGPLIVIANHAHSIDAFLVGAAMPKDSEILPVRFGVWHKYYWHFLNFPFLWLLGSFEVRRGRGLDLALQEPSKLLKAGRTVGIFPEGKRRHLGRPRSGRRGTPYLAIQTHTHILPVHIEGTFDMTWRELLLRKRTIQVSIGKPFVLKSKQLDEKTLNKMGSLIMQKIQALRPLK